MIPSFWRGVLPIQSKRFELGLEFKNIDTVPIQAFEVTNIIIESEEVGEMKEHMMRTFSINTLNPLASSTIWCEEMGTYMCGVASVSLKINQANILCYQTDQMANNIDIYDDADDKHSWREFFYIRNLGEYRQERTNNLVIFLSILTTILAALQVWKMFYGENI